MSDNLYPKSLDEESSLVAHLLLDAAEAIEMDKHEQRNANSKNYQSITKLANLVSEFVKTRENGTNSNRYLTELSLAKAFYSERGLRGITFNDLYPQLQVFAEDLLRFREISEERQTELSKLCIKVEYFLHNQQVTEDVSQPKK